MFCCGLEEDEQQMSKIILAGLVAVVAGVITPIAMAADMPGSLFDVYSVAVAPDGKRVYAGQGNGAPYAALGRDPVTGLLTYLDKPSFPFGGSYGNEFRHSLVVAPTARSSTTQSGAGTPSAS